jgi:hypothetical protein
VTPDIQPWQDGIEDGSGGILCTLTPGGLFGSAVCGKAQGGNDERPKPEEKSDYFIVA